jgi:hypothetical protein
MSTDKSRHGSSGRTVASLVMKGKQAIAEVEGRIKNDDIGLKILISVQAQSSRM